LLYPPAAFGGAGGTSWCMRGGVHYNKHGLFPVDRSFRPRGASGMTIPVSRGCRGKLPVRRRRKNPCGRWDSDDDVARERGRENGGKR
jgi:hypothetical protein